MCAVLRCSHHFYETDINSIACTLRRVLLMNMLKPKGWKTGMLITYSHLLIINRPYRWHIVRRARIIRQLNTFLNRTCCWALSFPKRHQSCPCELMMDGDINCLFQRLHFSSWRPNLPNSQRDKFNERKTFVRGVGPPMWVN